jgi:hypothetical protein
MNCAVLYSHSWREIFVKCPTSQKYLLHHTRHWYIFFSFNFSVLIILRKITERLCIFFCPFKRRQESAPDPVIRSPPVVLKSLSIRFCSELPLIIFTTFNQRSPLFPRLNNKKVLSIMNPDSTRVHWSTSPTSTQQQFQPYNTHHHFISTEPTTNMSQPQQSFPPGAGPNDTTTTTAEQFPPGHAYRRSQSNSPFRHTTHPSPYPQPNIPPIQSQPELKQEAYYTPTSAELYTHAQVLASGAGEGSASAHYTSPTAITRLPPILQVEKKQVTTSATQAASASRRRNEAHFACPVPGCGSTFTRRFNLRGTQLHHMSVFCNKSIFYQVIFDLTPKNAHMCVSTPIARKALQDNMTASKFYFLTLPHNTLLLLNHIFGFGRPLSLIASPILSSLLTHLRHAHVMIYTGDIKHYMPRVLNPTSVRAVKRPSAAWMP